MRLVSIDNIGPHARLAKTIYDGQGRVLLAKGIQLLPQYIHRLGSMGISSVYIEDDMDFGIEIDDVVSEQVRVQAKQVAREALEKVQAGLAIEARKVKQAVNDILDELLRNNDIMVHLTDIRSMEDHTFGHSVNVCILSMITGIAMGYDQLKLKDLGTGALLHDIGKTLIPESILNSGDVLSPENLRIVRMHTLYGFEILRKTDNISAVAAHIAYQHHERINGQGYPRNLTGPEIHPYAKIVAIADVYDALTTDRPYRQRMLPHQVVELIRDAQNTHFDADIAKEFLRNIAPYPKGTVVMLSTGQKGIVTDVKKGFPTRPIIRLLDEKNGQEPGEAKIVDLMKELTVFITDVLRE